MTAPVLRRPVRREFLDRLARPLLVRVLAPHAGVLGAHAISLNELAATAQTDRVLVHALWNLIQSPRADVAAATAELHETLLALSDAATSAGHEQLLLRDDRGVLDRDLSDEDLAAVAYLDHRALFDATRIQAGSSSIRAFTEYDAATPAAFPEDDGLFKRLGEVLGQALEARGRTAFCETFRAWHGDELDVEIVYGRLAGARDMLGKDGDRRHAITSQVTDRTTERAHAVYQRETGRLAVHGPDWMKELLRRSFGAVFFGDGSHYRANEILTLAPLSDLSGGLSADGVPNLIAVELHALYVELADGYWAAVGGRGDVRREKTVDLVTRALASGAPSEAKLFLLTSLRKRSYKLEIAPPGRLDFDRREPRLVQIVRDWLVARGMMVLPAHAANGTASLERDHG